MDETQSDFDLQQTDQNPLEIEVESKSELKEPNNGNPPPAHVTQAECTIEEKKTPDQKSPSSIFFHFVRLMKLFPNVHPATVHTVMTMCKNDFFTSVDRLLHAKHYKELYDNRKRMYQCAPTGNRCGPYSCTEGCLQNASCIRPAVIKINGEAKRSRKSRDKNSRQMLQLQHHQQIQESPITLQCTVPLRPLSPMNDLPTNNNNVSNVDEVQIVVTQQM